MFIYQEKIHKTSVIIFLSSLIFLFGLILFLAKPDQTENFWLLLGIFLGIIMLLIYAIALKAWRGISIDQGMIKSKEVHWSLLPLKRKVLITEVKELMIIYSGSVEVRHPSKQEYLDLKKIMSEEIESLLKQRKVLSPPALNRGALHFSLRPSCILLKDHTGRVRLAAQFFTPSALKEFLKYFPQTKYTWKFGQITFPDLFRH